MKPSVVLPLLLGLASTLSAAAPGVVTFRSFEYTGRDRIFEPAVPAGDFQNPILAGFYPDPSVCRVGDDYYLINSTFAYFPGIPVFHSRDLVNWSPIGHVIHRASQLKYDKLGVSRGIFAPAISHHGDTFYVVCTMVDSGGNFVVTAKNPAGPWSDPTWLDFEGIDPSIFFDDDGRAYLVNNGGPEGTPKYDGHRAIWIQEFDPAALKMVGPRRVLVNGGVDLSKQPVWIEGPHLYKRNGWYYLSCAEGGTAEQHSQVIFRAKTLDQPFEPWSGNPILTQRDLDPTAPAAVTSTGHADLFIGPDDNWWAVFLGCQPYAGKYYATGRETFLLPVRWTDEGWPVILPHGERVPYVVAAPHRANQSSASIAEPGTVPAASGALGAVRPAFPAPLTGNFTWRDTFDRPALSPLWVMLRAPHESWWSTEDEKGLNLTARRDALNGTGNPSYLGRRIQHSRFEAMTRMVVPRSPDISAGLVVLQNETHHYFFGVRREDNGLALFVEESNGGTPKVIMTRAIDPILSLKLRVTANEKTLSFSYATVGNDWKPFLTDADATVVTTQVAGGFVGATVGVYARADL